MKLILRLLFIVLVIGLLVVGCGKRSGIEGKIVDAKGQPMSGYKVIAKQVQPIKGYEKFDDTTGSDGVFKFNSLYPQSEYVFTFTPPDNGRESNELPFISGPEGMTSLLQKPVTFRFPVSNNIITDTKTGLQWWSATDKEMTWAQATDYAKNLTIGGGGWRLPTLEELENIYKLKADGGTEASFNVIDKSVWASDKEDSSRWSKNNTDVAPSEWTWAFSFMWGGNYPCNYNDSKKINHVLTVRNKK